MTKKILPTPEEFQDTINEARKHLDRGVTTEMKQEFFAEAKKLKDTAHTDGTSIFIDEKFVRELINEEKSDVKGNSITSEMNRIQESLKNMRIPPEVLLETPKKKP